MSLISMPHAQQYKLASNPFPRFTHLRLNNTNSIQALIDADYTYVVGDNSRPDLKPENPFWIFPTKVCMGTKVCSSCYSSGWPLCIKQDFLKEIRHIQYLTLPFRSDDLQRPEC